MLLKKNIIKKYVIIPNSLLYIYTHNKYNNNSHFIKWKQIQNKAINKVILSLTYHERVV